jgi:uncharacterized hydrophobic protein (TIGR00271 family)
MVVGPEYGAIISTALRIYKRDALRVRSGLAALVIGFAMAVAASCLFGLAVRALDAQPRAFSLGLRPVSHLIDTPNGYSVVIAVLAGIVGVVSLAEARASTLIGVFVSVTTIPAAADMGLSAAFGNWHEAGGSTLQLLLNVVILIVVGVIVLVVERWIWRRVNERAVQTT